MTDPLSLHKVPIYLLSWEEMRVLSGAWHLPVLPVAGQSSGFSSASKASGFPRESKGLSQSQSRVCSHPSAPTSQDVLLLLWNRANFRKETGLTKRKLE